MLSKFGFLRSLFVLTGFCCGLSYSNGTLGFTNNKVNLQDRLAAISKQMFAEGNDNFIVVEAMRDSLLVDGSAYSFVLTKDSAVLNNKRIDQKYAKLFFDESMLKAKSDGYELNQAYRISLQGNIKLRDVFDPASKFRKKPYNFRAESAARAGILDEMTKDGLAENGGLVVVFNKNGIKVNGKTLNATLDAKYRTMLKEQYHFDPWQNDSYLNWTREGMTGLPMVR